MNIEKHSIGPWYMKDGSMFNKANNIMLDEDIAILVDLDGESSTLLKIGRYENVLNRFNELIERYSLINQHQMYTTLEVIKFNVMFEGTDFNPAGYKPDGHNFTVDEICTILNWFGNCIGEQMEIFLKLPLEEAKAKIKSLQEIGF